MHHKFDASLLAVLRPWTAKAMAPLSCSEPFSHMWYSFALYECAYLHILILSYHALISPARLKRLAYVCRQARRELIEARLAEIEGGDPASLIGAAWAAHRGFLCVGVNWERHGESSSP